MRRGMQRVGRLVGGVLALASAFLTYGCTAEDAQRRPNVVIIVLDTTRADVLSAYGNAKPTTPHIDRLAAEGILFTRAFSTDFWTLPAHASLLTGQHPTPIGATSETNRLPHAAVTLAERMHAAGFRTGAFVSNAWVSAERGFAQGFDTFVEAWQTGAGGDLQLDRRTTSSARAWMTERIDAGEPFLLLVNLNSAHLPYSPEPQVLVELTPEPRPLDRVARLREVKGMWSHLGGALQLDEVDFSIMRELYEAEVRNVDILVGELIQALESRDALDQTVVIVTSDHGENIGDHGMIDHLLSMYDTTLRVPLVIRHPATFDAGRVEEGLVSLIDVVPTVLEIVGMPDEYGTGPGRSLVPPDGPRHAWVIAENDRPVNGIELMNKLFPGFDTAPLERRVRTLRTERYKLIRYSDGEIELYDLEADPGEEHDIAAERPNVRDELLARLEDWMQANPSDEDATPLQGRDPASIEQLRALGYID